ncbi:MAG: chalcone isomerase family protein [Glaciecola sp.]
MRMLFAVILLTTLWQVQAKNLQAFIENPETVGEARLSVLFWDIYDASLIAQNGQFNSGGPFALTLTYLRSFDGNDIASRSIDEMRGQGMTDEMKLAKWYQELEQIFPDVQEGQTITGVMDNNKVSHFYLEDQLIGSIEDAEFGKWFFDIWLSEKTSEPKMRQQLLGLQK